MSISWVFSLIIWNSAVQGRRVWERWQWPGLAHLCSVIMALCVHVWQQLCVAAYQEKTDTSNIARHNVMLPITLSCDPLSCDWVWQSDWLMVMWLYDIAVASQHAVHSNYQFQKRERELTQRRFEFELKVLFYSSWFLIVTRTFRIEKLTQQLQKFSETYENYLLVKNITIDVHWKQSSKLGKTYNVGHSLLPQPSGIWQLVT